MKKLLLVAAMLMCSMAWAETAVTKESVKETVITKETVKDEMLSGCVASGNTEDSCKCAVDGFETDLTKEDWDLLLQMNQVTQPDIAALEVLQVKMMKVIDGCGATK